MIYDKDTLNHHRLERPGTQLRDYSQVPLNTVGKAVQHSLQTNIKIAPEFDAIQFYLLNHAVAEVQQRVGPDEPLGDMNKVLEEYHKVLAAAGYRLFHYLMATTTREARHLSGDQENKLKGKHGSKCVQFSKYAKSHAQKALWQDDLGDELTVGDYLNYLCDVYNTLSWGSSYGGKRWGEVAQPLRDLVHGEISIEMLLDVGYTLAHNNGPIFNKGMHYEHYSNDVFLTILDCQRAGKIPEFVKNLRSTYPNYITAVHDQQLEMIQTCIPGFEVKPYMNWGLIQQLGAVGNYSYQKQAELAHWSHNKKYMAELADADKALLAKKKADQAKKAAEEKMYLTITPHVKVKKAQAVR